MTKRPTKVIVTFVLTSLMFLSQGGGLVRADQTVPTSERNSTIAVTIGGHMLHVPQGYIDQTDGYQAHFGYLHLRALLPCLLPETAANASEFHLNTLGNTITIRLSAWDIHQLTGARLLAARMASNKLVHASSHESTDARGDGVSLPDSDFRLYEDKIADRDIFVKTGSDPLFMLECLRYSEFPFPSCASRQVIDGSLLIDYRYSRSFIDPSLNESLNIDERVHQFIGALAAANPTDQVSPTGGCK